MFAVVGIVAAVTVVVVSRHDSSPGKGLTEVAQPNAAKVGQAAPDFAIAGLDGATVHLADYRGKAVVLNFWESWCHPCRQEFPLFRSALASGKHDFVMVGVDTGDLRGDARRFARQQHAEWPNGFDAGGTVARGYGVDGLPQTFFIRADGVIASRVFRGLTRTELDHELDRLDAK